MGVQALDHVNLRVADPAETIAFLTDVLGMTVSPLRDNWIDDAAGRPVIHVGDAGRPHPADSWRPFTPRDDSGAVHHVALSCTDYDGLLARIRDRGIDCRQDDFPDMGIRQILVTVPGGVMLELNFQISDAPLPAG